MMLNFGNKVINSDYIVFIQTMDCDTEHSIITLIDGSQITVRLSIDEIVRNFNTGGYIDFSDKTPIGNLNLSVRVYNICDRHGITTLGELIKAFYTGTINPLRLEPKSAREIYVLYCDYIKSNNNGNTD